MGSDRHYKPRTCKACGAPTYAIPGRKGLCLKCFCKKVAGELVAHIDKVTSEAYREKIRKW